MKKFRNSNTGIPTNCMNEERERERERKRKEDVSSGGRA